MIYKYTKCESVIAKILADANVSAKNIRVTDIREWIFEAIEKIGAPMQYVQKESGYDGCPILRIEDHQVPIPDDLESLTAVAYSPNPNGPWVQARKDDKTFKFIPQDKYVYQKIGNEHNPNNMVLEEEVSGTLVHRIHGGANTPIPPMPDKPLLNSAQLYSTLSKNVADLKVDDVHDKAPTYFIKPGWIVVNKPFGYIKLSYRSIGTDERGYPLIPDLASYQEAVYWYVMMKLNFPKFINGSLGGRSKYNYNVYSYIHQQWNFYRNQAYAEAMMPSEGDMMSIKNEWNKLVPDYNQDTHFFKDVGKPEVIYNDYYYGF